MGIRNDSFKESTSIKPEHKHLNTKTGIKNAEKNNQILNDEEISLDFNSSDPSSSSSSSSSHYFSTSSISTINSIPTQSINIKTQKKKKNKEIKLSGDKICSQALGMIKFLGTLNTKKLALKHEPRLRRTAFLEWISQLEIAFSSNKYTRTILANYSVNNKIKSISDKKVDLLVYMYSLIKLPE